MKSLFSVSRLIGKSQTRSSKRTSSMKSAFQENEDSQSQKRVVVDSTPSVVTAPIPVEDEVLKTNPSSETLPKEQDISFPPTTFHTSEVNKTHERKIETVEEPGYDLVLQPSAKASFGDWTELETGSGPGVKLSEAESAQVGIDTNAKGEQSLTKVSNGTNWTSIDVSEKVEEPSASLPSDAEWLQLDTYKTKEEKEVAVLSVQENGEITSETRLNEERAAHDAAHQEEMRTVREEKEKLTERVKELEEELHQAEHKLQLKMEQISKFVVDLDRKGEEIKVLNEEKDHIQQVAAREKAEFLDEIRSNEVIAARWQVAKELKDVETVELLAKQDDMQDELDNTIGDLSISRARVADLESANELLQTKKLLEQDATSATQNDAIAALKGQKARLIALVHTLRTNAKINERQNSMLMVQLKQQSDNLVAWDIPSIAKSVRRTTGPTLVEQAVRNIKALNYEIYQIAASLTDCVDEIEKRFVDESDGTAAALETLKSLLGTEIYAELDEQSCYEKDNYNPYILQTGFQVCLAACCMRIITSWYPAEPEYGKFLEVVYERIRGYGGAENAALWRKWTLQSCISSTNAMTKSILFDFIVNILYAMLSMSGWPKLGETVNLLDKFSDNLTEIVNLAVRLNTLAAETVMPGDLQAVTVEEGKNFVPNDMDKDTPESEWDNMRCDTPYSEAVVGCVGLGLKWRDEGDMYEAQLVLKPRVVLRKDKTRW